MTCAERARDAAPPAGARARLRRGALAPPHHRHARPRRTTAAARPARAAFAEAGLAPADVDCAQLYDAFTITPILFLEDLGFCAKGEGGPFVASGRDRPRRRAADEHERRRPLLLPPRHVRAARRSSRPCASCAASAASARSTAARSPSRTATAACCRARHARARQRGHGLSASSYARSMDFELSDEQRLIQQTAREFTDREIVAGRRAERRRTTTSTSTSSPRSPRRATSARSSRASTAARASTTSPTRCSASRSAAAARAMRTVVSVQTSLVCSTILAWGTEEQKQRYLPLLCSGEWLGCFGLTEPGTGSDAADQKTRAMQQDDGSWLINGAKMWISLGNYARLALIFAQTDPGARAPRHRLLPRRDRPARLPALADRGQDGPARPRTPRRSRSTTSSPAPDAMLGERRRRLQGRDDGARLRPLLGRRRLRRALPGGARRVRRLRQGAHAVRPPDRRLPARAGDARRHGASAPTRRGCSSAGRAR